MAEEKPFYAMSILEAWNWLINVPYLGIIMLGIVVFIMVRY